MKRLFVIFLSILALGTGVFAQTDVRHEEIEKPKAELIEHFGKVPIGHYRMVFDELFLELQNNPNTQGYIINFGTDREISRIEKLILDHIAHRQFDGRRITFVNGGKADKLQTQIWKVSAGAEPPAIEYIEEKKNNEK